MKYAFLLFSCFAFLAFGQSAADYSVVVVPIPNTGIPGFQSASVAYSGDEVLIVGGRLDGLHRRQPNVSFDSAGHNNQLIVFNLKSKEYWKVPVDHLQSNLRDQLKATNHCYTQVQDSMFVVGGYGISEQAQDHITFPSAIRFSVPEVIQAVKTNNVKNELFHQVTDSLLAETGGQLEYMNNEFYLVGGHLFIGRYNPRNGPSFKQTYSSEMRVFSWQGKHIVWKIIQRNEALLHKRDFNLVQVKTDSTFALAFSGVFRTDADLPFQTATRIASNQAPKQVANFRQFYNHYECPELVIVDPKQQATNVFFLGGISQFYDSLGVLVQDNNVPFIETISRVEISKDGTVKEYLVPTKMPARYGAGVSFVPNKDPRWNRKQFMWSATNEDSISMGYLLGGISTVSRNIFWNNEGKESSALNTVYQVFLVKNKESHRLNSYSNNPIQLAIEENPKNHLLYFSMQIPAQDKISLTVFDAEGKEVLKAKKSVKPGNFIWKKFPKYLGWYRVVVAFENHPEWNWEQWMFYDE